MTNCDYNHSPETHFEIINGLAPGNSILSDGIILDWLNEINMPGGSLGGEIEKGDPKLNLSMGGVGFLFSRNVNMPVSVEIHTGPRTPGDPVQMYDTDLFMLQGQLPIGDPDFDLLRITAGTGFGMPSPGHTNLTLLPGGNWQVDSFFDITYRIDFIGAPGGPLAGMSGSTTGTIRMQATTIDTCGNGTLEGLETCDDSDAEGGDGCSAACQVEPGFVCTGQPSVCVLEPPPVVCGDGSIDGAETCDDNNTGNGDGCSAACQVEPGFICTSEPSVCEPVPPPPFCGDLIVDPTAGEECEPPGTATCDLDCHLIPQPFCGDLIVDPTAGEECEPPGTATCDLNCHLIPQPFCGDLIVDPTTGEECEPPGTATCDLNCHLIPPPEQSVGGELVSTDNTALLLAGIQSSTVWMLPALIGIAGAGIYYIRTRMNKE